MIRQVAGGIILFFALCCFWFVWMRYIFGMSQYESLSTSVVNAFKYALVFAAFAGTIFVGFFLLSGI